MSNDSDEGNVGINLSGTGVSTLGSAKPAFTIPPQPQIVALGQPATFTATVTPNAGLKFQWSKGSATKFTDIAKATTTTLTLPAVTLADAAQLYRLRASRTTDGKIFADSQPATLTVVDRAGSRRNIAEGNTIIFKASASSSSTLRYLWRKDGGDLPADSRYSGGETDTLTIASLEPEDAGTYTCLVSAAGGTLDNGSHVLTIFNAPPVITPNPLVLPTGIVSGDYSFTIPLNPANGFATSYSSTTLPKGLRLNTSTGVISGSPTAASGANPFAFTLRAHNSLGTSEVPATLVIQPFTPGLAGSYLGLISRGPINEELGGRLDLTITGTGACSGKITLGKQTTKITAAKVTTEPASTFASLDLIIPRKNLAAVELQLRFDTLRSRIILGTVTVGTASASTITGWKNTWSTANPAADFDGLYNAALQVANLIPGDPQSPHGYGFGACKITAKDGATTMAGKLPDGDSYTASGFLGPDGDIAVFDVLPAGGSLIGLTGALTGTAPAFLNNSLASGTLTWNRPESTNPKTTVYKDGIGPVELMVSGGLYSTTGSVVMNRIAGPEAAYLSFMEAGLTYPSIAARWLPLAPGASLSITPTGPTATRIKLSRSTGAFSGSFSLLDVHPVTPSAARLLREVTFQGLIIPTASGHLGRGYFLLKQLPTPVFPPPPVQPELSGAVFIE